MQLRNTKESGWPIYTPRNLGSFSRGIEMHDGSAAIDTMALHTAVPIFISLGFWVAQLYPQALGSS